LQRIEKGQGLLIKVSLDLCEEVLGKIFGKKADSKQTCGKGVLMQCSGGIYCTLPSRFALMLPGQLHGCL